MKYWKHEMIRSVIRVPVKWWLIDTKAKVKYNIETVKRGPAVAKVFKEESHARAIKEAQGNNSDR